MKNNDLSLQKWQVTWSAYAESDPGDGTTIGTSHHVVTLPPSGIHENDEGTHHGKPYKSEERSSSIDGARRDAVAALLPPLRGKAGTYSLSANVNDEGSQEEELTVELAGEKWRFLLRQGRAYPKPPEALANLYALVTGKELIK